MYLRTIFALWISAALTGCATSATGPDPVPELRPGILSGYLAPEDYPDSVRLLPPPPAEGSAANALDLAINQRLLTLQNSPRFALAAVDNDLSFPNAAGTFACALNASITQADTPYLYQLLRRTLADAGLSTYGAKRHYQRKRPFLSNGKPNCAATTEQEMLTNDGSYPSGHTAIGWTWALILAGLAPDRADEILKRGIVFGDSRAVCNVHWPSDVVAGRTMGAAAFAVLQSDADFKRDLAIARSELKKVRAASQRPNRDCANEGSAANATSTSELFE